MLIPKLNKVFIYTCNGKYSRKDIKRFLKYIKINKETGCWEWTGHITKKGYGLFHIILNGKPTKIGSHVAAYEISTGKLVDNKMEICHKCDIRNCIKYNHLKTGTHQDNINDMMNRNRHAKLCGENNSSSKLTWKEINDIRHRYSFKNCTQKQLSKIFNIDQTVISDIVNNKLWYDKNYIIPKYKLGKGKNNTTKLNQEHADKIRIDHITGKYTMKQLSEIFNVSVSTISLIINNKIHKEISAS